MVEPRREFGFCCLLSGLRIGYITEVHNTMYDQGTLS